ncbi:glycosyltransferase family 4 protein [Massilimicrobiota timonensis]|nr:glycosyltransferase family 4 protein [Massilimicrobiota timonensis]
MIIARDLITSYKDKFIFDIRDYTYENSLIFKHIEKRIVNASRAVMISSNGFKKFLPQSDKYVLCHNFLKEEMNECYHFDKKEMGQKLQITFLGAVRHYTLDKKIVDCLEKDQRFQIVYHGYGATYDKLKEYVQNKNVIMTGKYDRKDKELLLDKADIINSFYDDSQIANKYAISNKFYDSIIYKIPLWANPKTYIGKKSIELGIGLNSYLDADKLYDEYMNLDKYVFEKNCNRVLNQVLLDEEKFYDIMEKFVN